MNTKTFLASCLAITLSGCGGNSSDSGAGSTPGNSVATDQQVPQMIESESGLIATKCQITGISMRPGSGTLSKSTSTLRAVVDFEITPGIDVNIYSAIFSVDGNDRILSDVTDFTFGLKVDGGKGQVLLSYNLNTAPVEYDWQFSYADPDRYNKVSVTIFQKFVPNQIDGYVCTASKEVNLILNS